MRRRWARVSPATAVKPSSSPGISRISRASNKSVTGKAPSTSQDPSLFRAMHARAASPGPHRSPTAARTRPVSVTMPSMPPCSSTTSASCSPGNLERIQNFQRVRGFGNDQRLPCQLSKVGRGAAVHRKEEFSDMDDAGHGIKAAVGDGKPGVRAAREDRSIVPIAVIPTCTVERRSCGFAASWSAASTPLLPSSACWRSLALREETTANSAMENMPFATTSSRTRGTSNPVVATCLLSWFRGRSGVENRDLALVGLLAAAQAATHHRQYVYRVQGDSGDEDALRGDGKIGRSDGKTVGFGLQ